MSAEDDAGDDDHGHDDDDGGGDGLSSTGASGSSAGSSPRSASGTSSVFKRYFSLLLSALRRGLLYLCDPLLLAAAPKSEHSAYRAQDSGNGASAASSLQPGCTCHPQLQGQKGNPNTPVKGTPSSLPAPASAVTAAAVSRLLRADMQPEVSLGELARVAFLSHTLELLCAALVLNHAINADLCVAPPQL
eukprot:2114534-Pleurochrysis_carterae.AAC.1